MFLMIGSQYARFIFQNAVKEKPSSYLQPSKEDKKIRQAFRETQLSGLMKETDQVAGTRGNLQLRISLQVTNDSPDNDRRCKQRHLLKVQRHGLGF